MNTNPITKYRADNNLSLEALGSLMGVNKSTVLRWEEGQVTAERAVEIEAAIGIPRHELRPDIFGAAA
jgi:DNA-binding transcriptional regulator YdaS (Cro superfamily)